MLYPKINSPFFRNDKGEFLPEFTNSYFSFLYENTWEVYEKADGMNVCIVWDGQEVVFYGKSQNAAFNHKQIAYLATTFTKPLFQQLLLEPCRIYGELVGPGCHTNSYQLKENEFILFDSYRVSTNCWQQNAFLNSLAEKFIVRQAPQLGYITLRRAVEQVYYRTFDNNSTLFPGFASEGYILRPSCDTLLTKSGERIITKLKFKDKFVTEFTV